MLTRVNSINIRQVEMVDRALAMVCHFISCC